MLRERIADLLDRPATAILLTPEPRPNDRLLMRVETPLPYRTLVDGPFDALVPAAGQHVSLDSVRAAADRLLLRIGGPGCMVDHVLLRLSYTIRPETWQPMSRDIDVIRPAGGWADPVIVTVPAFYRASQHFEGIELAAADRYCLHLVQRIEVDGHLPIIFTAVLAPGWEKRPLRLGFFGKLGPVPSR
jgi:hypothetical protein